MKTNYYIYCVTSRPENKLILNIKGFEEENIIALPYKDLCAHVSRTTLTYYEPNINNLQYHDKVINTIMEHHTVLPFSFSTISKNELNIIEILQKYYNQFKKNLEKIDGKIELGIKIFYKLDYEKEDAEDKIQCKTGKDYITKRYKRYLNRKKQTENILSVVNAFHDNLRNLCTDSCFSNPMKNNLMFNASYLVDKEKVDDFIEYVLNEKNKYPGYKIFYSGPWSPYHFVKIIKEGDEDE